MADRVPAVDVHLGTVEELHADAIRATGLTDFGDEHYRAGLQAFHTSLKADAKLTAAGRRFAKGAMFRALVNRLRIQREFDLRPEIRARPVGPAVVVLGLPRSGTTLLQNLLALDTSNRSLRQWEANTPAPPPSPDAERGDARVRKAQKLTWLLDRIAPTARAIHPTGPSLPTECVTLFAHSFASLELSAIYQVPSYTRWVLSTDMQPHYAYYAAQLQLLGWLDHRERWSLKSPAHLFWVDNLVTSLPEAHLVMLHRDPVDVIGSFCSLAAVMAATNTRWVDRAAIGAFWLQTWAEGVARAEAARTRLASAQLFDLRYADLVRDPVAAVASMYDAHGFPFDSAFAAAIDRYVKTHPQHRGGAHRYALEDFGLTMGAVRDAFAAAGPERWQ